MSYSKLKRFSILPFISLIIALSSVTNLLALDDRFYSSNDILYYSPDGECLGVSNGCGAEFSFASFNICHGVVGNCHRGVSYQERLKKSVPVIRNYDVAALQEVRDYQYNDMKKQDMLGSEYDFYPQSYNGREKASTNPIVWKRSVFDLVSGEKISGGTTSDASAPAANPLVKLRFKATGQEVYFISVHDPVGTTNAIAKKRTIAARNLAQKAKSLTQDGTPIVIGGDFNSKYRECGVRQNAEDCDRAKLPYCILTDNTGLWDAWDAKDKRTGKCPSRDGSDVDHIYTSTSNAVSNYNLGRGINKRGPENNGSDHATLSATITIQGDCSDTNGGDNITLTGSDNHEKAFNFFVAKGLSDIQAAGIIGNMIQESGIDPENIQDPGGRTRDPTGIRSGWGIIQWTPADPKVFNALRESGASGEIYKLSTQLNIVWGHLNNQPAITTGRFNLNDFKQINTIRGAVEYFETHIEGAGNPQITNRVEYAEKALRLYGGQGGGSLTAPGMGSSNQCGDTTSVSNGLSEGQGSFTDKGQVAGWDIIKANAILADRILEDTWYGAGWCASITARVISGKNWGRWDGTSDPNGMLRRFSNDSSVLHKDRNVPAGAILLYGYPNSHRNGHVVIYLGGNKILNDGVIEDAKNAESWGGGYVGWIDPNNENIKFYPKRATEANIQALKGDRSATW